MADRDIQIIIQAIDKTGSAIASINNNLRWLGGSITKLAVQFNAVSGSFQYAWNKIKQGFELAEMGAKALQTRESFRQVAATAGESADKILEAMKRASVGMIDDSILMQKAVKGITQGLKGDEIVKLTEAARIGARQSGEEITAVFDKIVDAVANKTPRALKDMGLITMEQMSLFSKAVHAGAEEVNLLDIVLANTAAHEAQFGEITVKTNERIQQFKTTVANFKEVVGMGLAWLLDKFYLGLQMIAIAALNASGGVMKLIAAYQNMKAAAFGFLGAKNEAAKAKYLAGSYGELGSEFLGAGEDLYSQIEKQLAGGSISGNAVKNKEKLKAAQKEIKEIMAEWNAAIERSKITPKKTKTITGGKQSAAEGDFEIFNAEKGANALAEYERRLTDVKATELEKRYIQVEEWATREYELLTTAYQNNVINEQQYSDKLLEIQAEAETQKQNIKRQSDESIVAETVTFWSALGDAVKNYTTIGESAFGDFLDSTSEKFMDFGDLAKDILSNIYQHMLKVLILKPLMSGVSGMFQEGGVFEGGRHVTAYAGGGVVYRPTLFPMAHGMGLMGEAGPEAVMPLTRTAGGKLGVMAQGGGDVNVVINLENQSDTPIKAEQTSTRFDGEAYVVGVVLKNIDNYGALRHAIAGVK